MKTQTLYRASALSGWLRGVLPAVLLSVMLFSCSSDNGHKWIPKRLTMVVFHPYCSMYALLQDDYNDIIANIRTNRSQLVVQLLHLISENAENYYLIETTVTAKGYRNDTLRRYRFSELDYTTLEGMKQIFSDVRSVQHGDSLALLIGSHGSGWIPLPEKPGVQPSSSPKKAFGSGNRFDHRHVAYFQTLTAALEANRMPLKFLLLDCRNSQNIVNAYNLRHITRWVIASPTEIPTDGMPYKTDFHRLLIGDYTGFGKAFVEHYRQKDEEATCSVVDTEQFDDLIRVMRTINAQYYEANIERVSEEARNWEIRPLGGYTAIPPDFQDFQDYV